MLTKKYFGSENGGWLSIQQLRSAVKVMENNCIEPHTVKDEIDASSLTSIDPCGKVWDVGDKYYIMELVKGD